MLFEAGAALITVSMFGIVRNSQAAHLRRAIKKVLVADKLETVTITGVFKEDYGFRVLLNLPPGLTYEKFIPTISSIEQFVTASGIRHKRAFGHTVEIKIGYRAFEGKLNFTDKLKSGYLQIPFFTPFGPRQLDFTDETNCHLIVGGATRMGKTVLFRLIATLVIRSTEGNAEILLIDNKVTDVYMFRGLPMVTIAETASEAKAEIAKLMRKVDARKQLLKSKKNVVDAKEFRSRYPDEPMHPIFVIIDEYGRFADDDDFQDMVTEISETAGYLDVHLVIGAQRPDASQVLNPRIKANILTKACFSTANETNSKIVIDLPDAAYLGMIQGRAILMDSTPDKVQVPYMSPDQVRVILKEYYRSEQENDGTGQESDSIVTEIPGIITDTFGEIDLPGSGKTTRNGKSNRKKVGKGRMDIADSAT